MNERKRRFILYMYDIIRSGILPQGASQLAYSFVLAIIPLLVMLISFLGRFALPADEIYMSMKLLLPSQAYEIVYGILEEIMDSAALGTVSVFTFVYFTSVAARAVIRTTDSVYAMPLRRRGLHLFVLSLIYAVIMILCLMLLLIVVVFGDIIMEYVFEYTHMKESESIMRLVDILRISGSFFVIWGILCFVYAASPKIKLKLSQVYKGALFASAGWMLSGVIFSFYVSNFSSYGVLFGSLGGIFVLLVWLYVSSYIMLLGIHINHAFMVCRE